MTTNAADAPRVYRLGQNTSQSLLGRRERGEVVVLCAGIAAGVLCAIASGGAAVGFVLLAGCILTALAVVYLPLRGRTLYRWLPLDVRYAKDRRHGRLAYESGSHEAGVTQDGTPVEVAPPTAVGPIKWMSIPFRGEPLAVLLHQSDGALTATLEVEGPGHGLFDGPELEASHARWGVLLRDLANGEGFLDRVAQIARTVPSEAGAHSDWVDQRPTAGIPEELVASYADLQVRVTTSTDSHSNYVVARMGAGEARAKAVRFAGGGDAGLCALMVREVEALADRLEDAGFHVVGGLSAGATSALIRSTYEPDRAAAAGANQLPRDAWPRRSTAQKTHLAADGWCHATAAIRWPTIGVGVGFLTPLLVQCPGVVRSISVVCELVPTEVAMREALSDLTHETAERRRSEKAGEVDDPRRSVQGHTMNQRAADVAQGAAGARLVAYVAVSAPSPEELENAKRRVRTAAARSWLVMEWCDKEHERALVNVLPFARGLR